MSRMMVLAMLVVACGHPHGGGTNGDGGAFGDDASSLPNDGPFDGRPNSNGGADGGVDPATCVVGVADGCCPVGQQYGGHDPDCASLACPSISESDPIELDDWQTSPSSGVGMAWTGRELVLAWQGIAGVFPNQRSTIIYERRDPAGAVTFGPVTHDDRVMSQGHTTPELGFEPASHTILFASSELYQRYAETLDATGAPASPATAIGVDCNPIMARFQIYPWQGSFLVAQDNDPCSSEQWHGARVDTFTTAGARTTFSQGDPDIYEIGMTYDGDRVVFSGGNQILSERVFTPPTTWSGIQQVANLNTYDTGISSNGTDFLIAYGTYYLSAQHQITSDPMAGTWKIDDTAISSSPAIALTTGANRQTVAPRMVWTGDGWIELMSSFPWESQGLPSSWSSFSTFGWSFAPDGSVRQMFQLDPDHPTYLVNAIWAGGKVAVTYATTDGAGHERRYLRYLFCN